jgi:hypothetical protein
MYNPALADGHPLISEPSGPGLHSEAPGRQWPDAKRNLRAVESEARIPEPKAKGVVESAILHASSLGDLRPNGDASAGSVIEASTEINSFASPPHADSAESSSSSKVPVPILSSTLPLSMGHWVKIQRLIPIIRLLHHPSGPETRVSVRVLTLRQPAYTH